MIKHGIKKVIEYLVYISSWLLRIIKIDCSKLARVIQIIRLQSSLVQRVPISTQFDGKVEISGTGNVAFGENCRLGDGVYLETIGSGSLLIGNNVRINKGSVISARTSISIGSDSLIGEYVSIRDANHGIARDQLIRLQEHESESITIGEDVWIARGSLILKGAIIGAGSVVAGNSVVNSRLGEYKIYAGAPARLIKER